MQRVQMTLQFAAGCLLQFLLILPYIARTPCHIIVNSTTLREPDTVIVDAAVDDLPIAEGWVHGLPAALRDAWVAWNPPPGAQRPRLTGTKVDAYAMQQTAPYDGPAQTAT